MPEVGRLKKRRDGDGMWAMLRQRVALLRRCLSLIDRRCSLSVGGDMEKKDSKEGDVS